MSLRLLLLLSLVSVDVSGRNLGTYSDMVEKVLHRKKSDFTFYGCQCGIFRGAQIVDEIDRCCYTRTCCLVRLLKEGCKDFTTRYYYTYENETITCSKDIAECFTRICECDKAAMLCIKSQKYIKENRRYPIKKKCMMGRYPPC